MNKAEIHSIEVWNQGLKQELISRFKVDLLPNASYSQILFALPQTTNTNLVLTLHEIIENATFLKADFVGSLKTWADFQTAKKMAGDLGQYYIDQINRCCQLSNSRAEAFDGCNNLLKKYKMTLQNGSFQVRMMFKQISSTQNAALIVTNNNLGSAVVSEVIMESRGILPKGEILSLGWPTINVIRLVPSLAGVEKLKPLYDQPQYWLEPEKPEVKKFGIRC